MSRLEGFVAALCMSLLLAVAVSPAHALAVHAPSDQTPTIEAGIFAGADTIFVAGGPRDAFVEIQRDLVLLREPGDSAAPSIGMLTMSESEDGYPPRIVVSGFKVQDRVQWRNSGYCGGQLTLDHCGLLRGLTVGEGCPIAVYVTVRDCVIHGDVDIFAGHVNVRDCTIVDGGIHSYSDGDGAVVGNHIIGAPATGIAVEGGDGPTLIDGNTIEGAVDGIELSYGTATHNVVRGCSGIGINVTYSGGVDHNLVEDCAGDGYGAVVHYYYGSYATFENNVARRCGGSGFVAPAQGGYLFTGNTVDSVALDGIHVLAAAAVDGNAIHASGRHGIWLEAGGDLMNNVVLGAGADGIRTSQSAMSNVVGRCAGDGIVAMNAHGNTSYLNGGDGYVLTGSPPTGEGYVTPDTVSGNVAFDNAGVGLRWLAPSVPTLACNDWFGNQGGATVGVSAGAGDFAVDPMFCDVASDSVALAHDSPLLGAGECGAIGARGEGCSVRALAVDSAQGPADAALALAASPNPIASTATITFTLPVAAETHITVLDAQGRRVAELARGWRAAGRHAVRWSTDARRGAGIYFVTVEAGGRRASRAVCILR